mmetsp:Transcript_42557/g.99732  ORF Transcript_42557/g.99732 Transcript_42557/m.99732 type:complete len:241 (+) Transcript_42557:1493-2215(+)
MRWLRSAMAWLPMACSALSVRLFSTSLGMRLARFAFQRSRTSASSTSPRTTPSASARTGRRTSPSRCFSRCARRLTSSRSALPTPTRWPARTCSPSSTRRRRLSSPSRGRVASICTARRRLRCLSAHTSCPSARAFFARSRRSCSWARARRSRRSSPRRPRSRRCACGSCRCRVGGSSTRSLRTTKKGSSRAACLCWPWRLSQRRAGASTRTTSSECAPLALRDPQRTCSVASASRPTRW